MGTILNAKKWNGYKSELEKLKDLYSFDNEKSISFARSFCSAVLYCIWEQVDYEKRWIWKEAPVSKCVLSPEHMKLARRIAKYFLSLNIQEYTYLLGQLYTILLPEKYRAQNGIYYTPPIVAERLLDLLRAEGADWADVDVLDPACGGGAFLVTVAERMLNTEEIKSCSAEDKLRHLETHLIGIELDPFAGWMTQVLLDIRIYPESVEAGRRLGSLVQVGDALRYALIETRKFDIIVGNPPYGKVQLEPELRRAYSRSLYGHANLYGLFVDAALRLRKEKGLIGFVMPTSFLGGKYFSNLRAVLIHTAPLLTIDFIAERSGVFEQVLQETCLAVFGNNREKKVKAAKLRVENNQYAVEQIGSFPVGTGTKPWIIAREPEEAKIIRKVNCQHTNLEDYGYKVSTGQLVWNRLKSQILAQKKEGVKPIIWAEAVTFAGTFSFDYQYRKDKRFIMINREQDFLLCKDSVVLLQRTTAKEQQRRLQTCVLPQDFITHWGGVVIENHVNMIRPISSHPLVSLEALSALLNSNTVDKIFRCVSGSVAVSAAELHAVPLPPAGRLRELEYLIQSKVKETDKIENVIMKAYGL